jgi:hypothetical protein
MSDSMSQYCPNCEAQTAEIERLREEVKELMDELAYHGVYPRPLAGKAEQ